MSKEDWIRQFILENATSEKYKNKGVIAVIDEAKYYADKLFPVDPMARHKDICRILRYMDFPKLAAEPIEEKYEMIDKCLARNMSQQEINLYSHLCPSN